MISDRRKDQIALLLILLPMATAAAVLMLPSYWIGQMIFLQPAPMAIGAWLIGRRVLRRPRAGFWLALAAALFLLPFATVYRTFGEVDMISFLFHMQEGITGIGPMTVIGQIAEVAASLFCLLAGGWALSALPGLRRLPAALGAAFVLLNPAVLFAAAGLLSPAAGLDLTTRLESPHFTPTDGPAPDIVQIFLEGTDRRFLALPEAPQSARALAALEARALSLTGIRQVAGTGWTIAGMVASHCGVPLLPRGLVDFSVVETTGGRFMPGVDCLGDELSRRGYRTSFLMGASDAFAGTAAFFRTHGHESVLTYESLADHFTAAEIARARLGPILADDGIVYDLARQRFAADMLDPTPFAMVIATIGPHGVPSYLSSACAASGRAEHTTIAPASECLAVLTEELIGDLQAMHRASGRPNGLRIIVQSDHLNHGRRELPRMADRQRNLVLLIGGPGAGEQIAAPGSMMDVYPTLLAWLGFAPSDVRAGLGRSLLTEDAGPSLVAEFGQDRLDRLIRRNVAMFGRLWEGSH
ncbi:sulfatase-like hydrolase/transferase [Pseudogemmobacter humi]|uniref:Phosphoglycerol transferase I n=1 Tax=Pseudogemmobacter humi TaxID=2483812 RepID=A0A3P5X181_9RHOB|nr:sulfatase-like hydrolase/transferase [Pseudogemmobacter humi]VDC28039.1 phosphoglycerol transferase I [Pseudogemmobacter humi]